MLQTASTAFGTFLPLVKILYHYFGTVAPRCLYRSRQTVVTTVICRRNRYIARGKSGATAVIAGSVQHLYETLKKNFVLYKRLSEPGSAVSESPDAVEMLKSLEYSEATEHGFGSTFRMVKTMDHKDLQVTLPDLVTYRSIFMFNMKTKRFLHKECHRQYLMHRIKLFLCFCIT